MRKTLETQYARHLAGSCSWIVDQSMPGGLKLVNGIGETVTSLWRKGDSWSTYGGHGETMEDVKELAIDSVAENLAKVFNLLDAHMERNKTLKSWNTTPCMILSVHEKIAIEDTTNKTLEKCLKASGVKTTKSNYGFAFDLGGAHVTLKKFFFNYNARKNACMISKTQTIELTCQEGGVLSRVSEDIVGISEEVIEKAVKNILNKARACLT